MILTDTSVWVDHLRAGDAVLAALLDEGRVLAHPWVTAEIAVGSLRDRATVLSLLDGLPQAPTASVEELRHLIEQRMLFNRGVGLVDVGLLAACLLVPDCRLLTRDMRLAAIAGDLGVLVVELHDPR
jgi:predicted nucleic acid-binding protein